MGALERPQLSQDLSQKQEKIMERMRRATAADEAVQGGATGNSRTTATEVSTQLQQAQMRFATKIQNLEYEGYAQLGLLIFKLVQIFVTTPTATRIVGKNGVFFKDFDPWEYSGEWEAHVKLDTSIKRDQVEVGLKDQAVFEAMKGNPAINQVELTRWWVQKKDPNMTDDMFNKMLMPPVPPSKPEAKDFLNVAYKDLEPWGRYQAQKDLGWDPDPSLQGDMQNRMLEQANQAVDHMDPATGADGTVVPGMESIINPPTPPDGMGSSTPAKAPAGLAAAAA
jgi:hypothetical protein